MNKEEYAEALNHPLWKAKRQRILRRDGYRCRKCGSVHFLHVHHLKYEGDAPWQTREKFLITLCKRCHKQAHKDKDKMKNSKIKEYISITQYRKFEKEIIVKNDFKIVGNKNIIDFIGESEEKVKNIVNSLWILRTIMSDVYNAQKTGSLKISSLSEGNMNIEINLNIDFKHNPMSPTKVAKLLKEVEIKNNQK